MGKSPDVPDVPDLDLPTGNASTSSRAPVSRQQPTAPAPKPAANDDDDLFGGGIERGGGSGNAPMSGAPMSQPHRGKAISVDFGVRTDDDDFGGEIERGGGSGPTMPSSSMSPSSRGGSAGPISRAPVSLDVSYRRLDPRPTDVYEPSTLEKIGARAVPLLGLAASLVPLLAYVHRPGARSIAKLVPRALDASSTMQSGVLAGVFVVAAVAVGFLGLRARPRSYAMVVSGCLFLVAALAMVTVMLVSTDESPQPADGARLIPYLIPVATLLLGLGTAGRGVPPFFRGGARRGLSFVYGALGGVFVFAAIALSTY